MNRNQALQDQAHALGLDPMAPLQIGGRYLPVARDGRCLCVSGQIPRVGTTVVVTGAAGRDVDLAQAQHAARVCAWRALALLKETLGDLDRIDSVLRMGVYVQSAADFTQHSEVADAASDLIHAVLGPAGGHARTTVGVYQLPKNATVELELMVAANDGMTANGMDYSGD